jgi:thymidine kinase
VLIVKYAKDQRYDDAGIATHCGQTLPAVAADRLAELQRTAEQFDVIGIDEGQFFPDVASWCEEMANRGKIVLVAGLDGTFQRRPFQQMLDLVPLAEDVTKLRAVCMACFQVRCLLQASADHWSPSRTPPLASGQRPRPGWR